MSKLPVYMTVANALTGRILNGQYQIGDALPTEREICESFGISRHTARESLRQLEQRGLIARRQGSGSTVTSSQPSMKFEQNIQNIDDLLQQGNISRLEVVATRDISSERENFANQIADLGGKYCIWVRALRFVGRDVKPLALVDVHVSARAKTQADRLLDKKQAARQIVSIIDVNRIARIEQSLSAVKLTAEQAGFLRVKPGDAALRTLRHYFNTGQNLMVVADSLYRGDRYNYRSTLHRG